MPVGKNSIARATNSKEIVIDKKVIQFQKNYVEVDIEKITSKNKKTEQNKGLEELVKKFGIIEPLILRQTSEISFELLFGYENFNLAKKLDIKKIPSIIIVCNDDEVKQILKVLNSKQIEAVKTEKENVVKVSLKNSEVKIDLPFYLL